MHSFTQSVRLQMQRQGTPHVQVVEMMAPLVDAPFSAHVVSDQKMAPADVITTLLAGLEDDQLELHIGATAHVYQELRRSSAAALAAVNATTGG